MFARVVYYLVLFTFFFVYHSLISVYTGVTFCFVHIFRSLFYCCCLHYIVIVVFYVPLLMCILCVCVFVSVSLCVSIFIFALFLSPVERGTFINVRDT